MEIIFSRGITLNKNPQKWRDVTKSYQSNAIPRVGDKVETSAFHRDEEVKVTEVVFNYEQKYVYVYLEILNIESDEIDVLKRNVDIYISHDWKCGFYGFDEE